MPKIPQIQIQQKYAKIGINTQPAKLEYKQPQPVVGIQQQPITVEIRSENSKVLIDQSRAWAAYGSMSPIDLTKKISEQALQIGSQAIAEIAEKGNRLAAIQNKTDPIPEMAREAAFRYSEIDYLGEASRLNVDIDVIPSSLNINWTGGDVSYSFTPQRMEMNYLPGKVEIYLAQKNSIKIEYSIIDKTI